MIVSFCTYISQTSDRVLHSFLHSFLLQSSGSMSDNHTSNGCPFPNPFPIDLSVLPIPISAGSVHHDVVTTFIPLILENKRTEFGFHPWRQSQLGLSNPIRSCWPQFNMGPPSDDHVDWVPYSGHQKFDFCMKYEYDVPKVFYCPISGEFLVLPVTEVIYRRDPLLYWAEIEYFLLTSQAPTRYSKTGTGPMSRYWFRSMCRRFYMEDNVLFERSTRFQVVQASHDFENACLVLPWNFNNMTPVELLRNIQSMSQGWYVDGLTRATWFLSSPLTYFPPSLIDL